MVHVSAVRRDIPVAVGASLFAGLLAGIEQADKAQIAFGEERYWMTDLAVSQLTLSERNAAAARAQVETHLGA